MQNSWDWLFQWALRLRARSGATLALAAIARSDAVPSLVKQARDGIRRCNARAFDAVVEYVEGGGAFGNSEAATAMSRLVLLSAAIARRGEDVHDAPDTMTLARGAVRGNG
jgi:hypothetical protein